MQERPYSRLIVIFFRMQFVGVLTSIDRRRKNPVRVNEKSGDELGDTAKHFRLEIVFQNLRVIAGAPHVSTIED